MNTEIKEKWINALLSGKYKQTTRKLCRLDENEERSYCCLGVLIDLYQKECDINPKLTKLTEENEEFYITYNKESNLLPNKVSKWSGVGNLSGNYGSYKSLAFDNDSGKSFLEIAEIIREKF